MSVSVGTQQQQQKTTNQDILNVPDSGTSATLFQISRGFFSVRIALEMEARVDWSARWFRSAGSVARKI